MTLSQVEQLLGVMLAEVKRLQSAQHVAQPGWTDQHASPLGNRRHCAAARRLVEQGDPGAAVVARRYLLSPSALAAELAATSRRAKPRAEAPGASAGQPQTLGAEFARRLQLVGGE